MVGRYDASTGLVMYGDGKGNFKPAAISETGFIADNENKALGRVSMANTTILFLVTQNSDSLKIFRENKTGKRNSILPLQKEVSAIATLANGSKRKIELGYGSSYLSQSSRSIIIKKNLKHIEFYDGKKLKTRAFDF